MTPQANHRPRLRLVTKCAQWISKDDIKQVPRGLRGIYALLRKRPRLKKFDVVYIGLSEGQEGIRERLKAHAGSKRKRDLWTHFSLFEVWPNITPAEIAELEGLFREIYRKDRRANRLNRQRRYRPLQKTRIKDLTQWNDTPRG
jgi:hypothetical protein